MVELVGIALDTLATPPPRGHRGDGSLTWSCSPSMAIEPYLAGNLVEQGEQVEEQVHLIYIRTIGDTPLDHDRDSRAYRYRLSSAPGL